MHKKLLISSKGHQYNNNKTRTNASGSLLSAPTITTTTTTNQKSQQPVPTKKKIKKLKIVIKAKERTAEEIARDENWKKSLVETVKKLKPTFNDMDNHLPDAIAVGTICEYLSDDYFNGYAGIRYEAEIVNILELNQSGQRVRKYHIRYAGDWEEELEAGAALTEEVDALLVRPKPSNTAGSSLAEFARGDQVDVLVDPTTADGEWHSGTVLRNLGDLGYHVLLDRGSVTHHVIGSNHIRPQVIWLGKREPVGLLNKRTANKWMFKKVPCVHLPPDEENEHVKSSGWDRQDKNDEKDADVNVDELNAEDAEDHEDDNLDDEDDDGWGSDGGTNNTNNDGWGSDEPDDDIVDDNWGKTSNFKKKGNQRQNQGKRKRKTNVGMFLNGALGARKKKKVKGKSSKVRRIVDNFESNY